MCNGKPERQEIKPLEGYIVKLKDHQEFIIYCFRRPFHYFVSIKVIMAP